MMMLCHVSAIIPDVDCGDVTCKRLKSCYETLYASYYVCVSVDSDLMKDTTGKLMSENSWPSWLLVRRYFKPKNGSE